MLKQTARLFSVGCLLFVLAGRSDGATPLAAPIPTTQASWTPCGWGGGGFFYCAAYHPSRDGVIYMGGDVAGVYKTEDHGRNWRLINNGIADYGIFSLAVDRAHPQTVYAATEGGLCKSEDAGEHWTLLPHTERKELRITGEKGRSIRCIAVDPTDSNVVYAASPAGKVYKSTDGGQTWNVSYARKMGGEDPEALRVQFGKIDGQFYGGIWLPLAFPKGAQSVDCVGFGMAFKGDGSQPRDAFLTLKTANGISYRSKNLHELFKDTQWRDVVLRAGDFAVDPDYAAKHHDTPAAPATPDWSTVNRMDFSVVGSLPTEASIARFGKIFFAFTNAPGGEKGTAQQPIPVTVKEFSKDKAVPSYGNIRIGDAQAGTIYSVTVCEKDPTLVLTATSDAGLVMSQDRGQTWNELETPKNAASATFDPADPNTIYGAFHADGIWKSTDKGRTWTSVSNGLHKKSSMVEVVISPARAQDVYAIGNDGWNGQFYASHDGGASWTASSKVIPDVKADPTLPAEGTSGLSTPTNLTINPLNPKELFISANWRPCLSEDAGITWTERDRGADISVITDIRFEKTRTYVSVMDEGALVSEDNGANWRQLWPLRFSNSVSGHNWRLAISDNHGADRIVATLSPWDTAYPPRVIISDDGGKTSKICTAGLPDYITRANTMWGTGYPRALAADPKDPNVLYLGIDGDPSDGKSGGGIFKSIDGGSTWKQLPQQPGSRRMFFGLAVDPTDSQRVYWGATGQGGGLYRSDDAGATWKHVFSNEQWIFNLMVTNDGTVYCPGTNLWRSADHGKTWKQLTHFNDGRTIIGLEADPRDPKTVWISTATWDGSSNGAVYKTIDAGATWEEITGDLRYRKPMVLRFNPQTNELWAGGVGLFKLKQ
jgi:photosystem II stability/assembly factor-like uncharacterized protein